MKLSLPNDVYIVRETGLPVEGRMKVYLHESDTYADVFTLDGADYVQAENPQLLHVGLPEASLFTDTGVYDIVIEQYIGPEGAMSVESPDEDFAKVDEFQWGLDFDPESFVANRVDTIDELRRVDPALKAVTVLWYNGPGDCVPRTYWWDAAAVNDEDGGYVICSEVTDTGRWILMWDEQYVPSCVYGVYPDDTANMNLLLNFPSTVGSFSLKTAQGVRFHAGVYSTGVDYATDKDLMFDEGARFTDTEFTCPRAFVTGSNTSYAADFYFTGENVEAHSGWFRTVNSWWHCKAHTMVIDEINHFASNTLDQVAELDGTVIVGSSRVLTTYVNGSYLWLKSCAILGAHIFNPSADYLRLQHMVFTTDWFTNTNANQYDFGAITSGHRLDCRTLFTNTVEFSRISNPNIYYLARLANGDTEFDGHGATYSMFTVNDQFTKISGCHVPSMIDHACATWKDVTVDAGLVFGTGGSNTVHMEGCSFFLGDDLPVRITAISLDRCNVATGSKWRTSTRITVTNSNWSATCELPEANKTSRALAQPLSFDHCTLGLGGNYIWTNNVVMTNCVSNAHVYNVPYHDGTDFRMVGTYVGNSFVQGALIECQPKNMPAETEVYDVRCDLTFKDNRFEQDDARGIVLPYYTYEFDNDKLFVSIYSGGGVYRNNTGKCPDEQPSMSFSASTLNQTIPWDGESDGMHYQDLSFATRVWNMSPSRSYSGGLVGIQYERGGDSWNPFNGQDARVHYGAMLHAATVGNFTEESNDQFSVVHCWRKIQGWDADLYVAYFNM